MIYYSLQLSFHPLAVVGKYVRKQHINSYVHEEKQYTILYKITEYTK
jgi:hypothetical protein